MKKILIALFIFLNLVKPVLSNNFTLGSLIGESTRTTFGYNAKSFEVFLSFGSETRVSNSSETNILTSGFGYIHKSALTKAISFVYGFIFSNGSYEISGEAETFNISRLDTILGVSCMLNEKISIKFLISPYSSEGYDSSVKPPFEIKDRSYMSSMIGMNYNF